MSRRSHHPIRRHVRPRHPDAKRGAAGPERPDAAADAVAEPAVEESGAAEEPGAVEETGADEAGSLAVETAVGSDVPVEPEPLLHDGSAEEPVEETGDEPPGAPVEAPDAAPAEAATVESPAPPAAPTAEVAPSAPPVADRVVRFAGPATPTGSVGSAPPPGPPGAATAPQLRRFIKSRSYIPMHELRRRFGIVVEDDDVAAIAVGGHTVYVGLPPREGELLGELLRAGDIGYEASFDPVAPVIVGVFPIRPVTRG